MTDPTAEFDLAVATVIAAALSEDLGQLGDISTLSTVGADQQGRGTMLVKADGVVAGLDVATQVFLTVDPDCTVTWTVADGAEVAAGIVIGHVTGPERALLTAERTALNLLQRMSGIATMTRAFVQAVPPDCSTRILDTRKTVPGLRLLDKRAVALGGGLNHRIGLFDMAMLKDNHIDAAGSIPEAVARTRAFLVERGLVLPIEVETRTLAEVEQAARLGVERIMLDNMTLAEMTAAVRLIGGRAEVEASGNMTLGRIAEVARTGVDFISVGALTHSVTALDISFKVRPL